MRTSASFLWPGLERIPVTSPSWPPACGGTGLPHLCSCYSATPFSPCSSLFRGCGAPWASFDRAETWEAAVWALRHAGQREIEIFSPAPCPQLERLLPPSPVKFFTCLGALVGFAGGLILTIGTALAWPLITGGKAIVSIP